MQRLTVPGRGRVDRGLGSVDVVTLAQARAWALDNKLAVKRGEDPFAGPQRSTVPTLRKILTAARPSEARLARWGEIAEDAREWRIPACRMKRDREHVKAWRPAAAVHCLFVVASPPMLGRDFR